MVSYGDALTLRARSRPTEIALTVVAADGSSRPYTWTDLDTRSDAFARWIERHAPDAAGRPVACTLPNGADAIAAMFGVWKVGGWVVPLRADTPPAEQEHFLRLIDPSVVIGAWQPLGRPHLDPRVIADLPSTHSEPLQGRPLPVHTAAIATGGSTGRPKLIFMSEAAEVPPAGGLSPVFRAMKWAPGQTQLVAGPLYHGSPFRTCIAGLLDGQRIVLLEGFAPQLALDVIELYRVQVGWLVPTMMVRMLREPDINRRHLDCVVSFVTTGGSCPEWVMRGWIELFGAERIYDGYSNAEGYGFAFIRGDEWVKRPGSVGRPFECAASIRDETGRPLPAGETGQIYMRRFAGAGPLCSYLGSPPLPVTEDGYCTAGDIGRVDDDGYLFIEDRRSDLISTGGANVYPTEVEGVILAHPKVHDVAVVGIPDDDWGRRVHAIVVARPESDLDLSDLRAFIRDRIAGYKTPKTFEIVESLPRNDMGKINRSALATARTPTSLVTEMD